jgi:hypothetical protein
MFVDGQQPDYKNLRILNELVYIYLFSMCAEAAKNNDMTKEALMTLMHFPFLLHHCCGQDTYGSAPARTLCCLLASKADGAFWLGYNSGLLERYTAGGRLVWEEEVRAGVRALATAGSDVWAGERLRRRPIPRWNA